MKNLEQIQEENRKAIILANNPEAKDYDEALEMELESCDIDCAVMVKKYNNCEQLYSEIVFFTNRNPDSTFTAVGGKSYKLSRIKKIIGKPLTLERIILSLHSQNLDMSSHAPIFGLVADTFYFDTTKVLWNWDLTKTTLEEQTEETQRAINKLLTK